MKFLTEYDLRKKYQENPFGEFTITKEIRLTPGGRQYLLDQKVKIRDEKLQKDTLKKEDQPIPENKNMAMEDWFYLRCEVLKTASQLENVDLLLAQELCALEKCLSQISQGKDYLLPTFIQLKEDKLLDEKNLEEKLSSVSMYLQLPRGTILIQLYSLYFALRKVKDRLSGKELQALEEICRTIGQLIIFYLGGGVT